MTTLDEKMRRIAEERDRLAREEAEMRDEAMAELARISDEILVLEEKKEQLESFLGIDENVQRAAHGQIQQLCIGVLSQNPAGLSSGQVRDFLETENPGMKLSSVPATLSRMLSVGKVQRDQSGRYTLA